MFSVRNFLRGRLCVCYALVLLLSFQNTYGVARQDSTRLKDVAIRPAYLSLLVFNRPYFGCSFFGSYGWYHLYKLDESSNESNAAVGGQCPQPHALKKKKKEKQKKPPKELLVSEEVPSFGVSVLGGFGYIFRRYCYLALNFNGNFHVSRDRYYHNYAIKNHLMNLNTIVTLGILFPKARMVIGGDIGIETSEEQHIAFSQTCFIVGARLMWHVARKLSFNACCTYKFGRSVRCALLPHGEKDLQEATQHNLSCINKGGALHYSVGLVVHL